MSSETGGDKEKRSTQGGGGERGGGAGGVLVDKGQEGWAAKGRLQSQTIDLSLHHVCITNTGYAEQAE